MPLERLRECRLQGGLAEQSSAQVWQDSFCSEVSLFLWPSLLYSEPTDFRVNLT